jgi:nicotinate-nucleotide adenylyltransferase
MERIGVLGGTFDPPHIGHLILAEYAADALALTNVLFVPAADPPHKQREFKTPVAHRLRMLELALKDNPRFGISRIDIDRLGPHYSVDMIRIINNQYPSAEIYFVMGSDSLRDLPTWYRPDELVSLCKLAVMRRSGVEVDPGMHEQALPGISGRVVMFNAPLIEVSSTEIVSRLAQGKSIRYQTPDAVREYIMTHRLYGATL